ncbi:hypothetical protein CRG98_034534 [Punica granatum]|uniref:DC1 domain-containing protein n=1 Tax=Punica granatum TaxID=22663 RepID=A0A2I0IM40_PUNGR|nr:hypothetical protein CRG98_034534 [Punica granatum]
MEIQHPSHSHPYVLTTDDSLTDRRCKGCGHRGPGPMYACFECKFYFHKSCIELSTQIVETPLHPLHPLKLEAEWGNKCQCCYRFCYFAYKCEECDYKLDPQCISLTPILKLRDPDHLLFLLDKVLPSLVEKYENDLLARGMAAIGKSKTNAQHYELFLVSQLFIRHVPYGFHFDDDDDEDGGYHRISGSPERREQIWKPKDYHPKKSRFSTETRALMSS